MRFVTLTFFFLIIYIAASINCNTKNTEYCKLNCEDEEHTACECVVIQPRKVILDGIYQFRKDVVDFHNKWRNKVANGDISKLNPIIKASSNMRSMNYDYELEYFATCLAGRFVGGEHDTCRHTRNGSTVGQNLIGDSLRNTDAKYLMEVWASEYENIVDKENLLQVSENGMSSAGPIHHFIQIINAETDLIGCARVWNTQVQFIAWRFSIICNYASTTKKGIPIPNMPVYTFGDINCTKDCISKSCDQNYTSLCGNLNILPRRGGGSKFPEISCSSESYEIQRKSVILVMTLVTLFLLY